MAETDIPAFVLTNGAAYLHGGDELDKEGYWGAKTSSVNFCERDYQYSPYVAEFWNTLSSIWIVLLPLLGLLYSNPTGERRFKVAYMTLIIVGLGSVTLHLTLAAIGQSFDELPMLWMCASIFYNLVDNDKNNKRGNTLAVAMFIFVLAQTLIYLKIQSLYEVFVTGYLTMVATIIFWTARKAFWVHSKRTLRYLWLWSVGLYVAVGSWVWILDMYYCKYYEIYYDMAFGITFHILWHFAAGLATYLTIQQLIFLRVVELGGTPELILKFYFLPTICITGKSKNRGKVASSEAEAATRTRRSKRLRTGNS